MNTNTHAGTAGQESRILAVLLLLVVLSLALFSDVFRFGRDRSRTTGQMMPVSHELCDWFTTK